VKGRVATIARELKAAWPYFVPAWLHALVLPQVAQTALNLGENLGAFVWLLSLAVWLPPLIPVLRHTISLSRALLLTFLPYVPQIVYQIATMPD